MLKKVNDETLRQLTKSKDENGPAGGGGRKVSEVVAYRSVKDIPPTREMAIQVRSTKYQTALFLADDTCPNFLHASLLPTSLRLA